MQGRSVVCQIDIFHRSGARLAIGSVRVLNQQLAAWVWWEKTRLFRVEYHDPYLEPICLIRFISAWMIWQLLFLRPFLNSSCSSVKKPVAIKGSLNHLRVKRFSCRSLRPNVMELQELWMLMASLLVLGFWDITCRLRNWQPGIMVCTHRDQWKWVESRKQGALVNFFRCFGWKSRHSKISSGIPNKNIETKNTEMFPFL